MSLGAPEEVERYESESVVDALRDLAEPGPGSPAAEARFRRALVSCLAAALSTLVVTAVIVWLNRNVVPAEWPGLIYLVLLVAGSFAWTRPAGYVAAVLSFFLTWYLFSDPPYSFALNGVSDAVDLGSLGLAYAGVAGLHYLYDRRRRQGAEYYRYAREQAAVAQERTDQLKFLAERLVAKSLSLQTVIDSMPSAVLIVELPGGRAASSNLAAVEMLGEHLQHDPHSRGCSQAYGFLRVDGTPFPTEDFPLYRAFTAGETTRGAEVSYIRNGRRRYALLNAAPLEGASGNVVGAVAVIDDITELHEVKARLEQEQRFSESVIQHAPAGIAVFRSPEHRLVLANDAFKHSLGIGGVDIIGWTAERLCPEVLRPSLLDALDRVYRTGESYHASEMPVSAGEPPALSYWNLTCTAVENKEGQVGGLLLLIHEATEQVFARKRIEELASQAKRHADQLAAVFDSIADGVTIADSQGNILTMNPASLKGHGLPDLASARNLAQLALLCKARYLDGCEMPMEEWPMSRALRGESFAGLEMSMIRPDGAVIIASFSGAPVRDENGNVIMGVTTFRDIGAYKEAERAKDEFLSIASHELKNPLTSVKGYAEMILKRVERQGPAGLEIRHVQTIHQQSNRMASLIEELLDISRIQMKRMELRRSAVDLVPLARSVVDRLQVTTGIHQLSVQTTHEHVRGSWDAARLERVLSNLVENAIKYSPEGGPVVITVDRADAMAVVVVEDEGVGIPEASLPHLFDRYFQAHKGGVGLGLGLYITSEIIKAHGGSITVESEEGHGSRFTVRLPFSA